MSLLAGRAVLVTGGAGFIGSHLVEKLLASGVRRCVVVDDYFLGSSANLSSVSHDDRLAIHQFDARDADRVEKLLLAERIDLVFNLAVIPLPASLERPGWSARVNFELTLALCELLRAGLFARLVHFSSSEAYGTAVHVPMSEAHPLSPTTPYAASKAAADHLVSGYARTFGVTTMIVRPFNNFGPRQNMREYAGVIPTALQKIYSGSPVTIFGDGRQTRDYIFAPDTASITVRLVEEPRAWGQVVNVASGVEISLLELIDNLASLTGKSVDLEFAPERPGDVRRHVADTALVRSLLDGDLKLTPFNVALQQTVRWYREELFERRTVRAVSHDQ